MVVETICDEDPAIWQECDVLRLGEMSLVVARHTLLTQSEEQPGAIVREDMDHVERLVDHPDAPLGIVRADPHPVRARAVGVSAEVVPLVPHLQNTTLAIEGVQAVSPRPALRLKEDVDVDRPSETEIPFRHGRGEESLASHRHENPVCRLSEHTRISSERVPDRRERLMPAPDDIVRTRSNRPSDLCSHLSRDGPARNQKNRGRHQRNSGDSAHDRSKERSV